MRRRIFFDPNASGGSAGAAPAAPASPVTPSAAGAGAATVGAGSGGADGGEKPASTSSGGSDGSAGGFSNNSNSVSADSESGASVSYSIPSSDDFGWDSWDGSSDALPEPLRPWADRFNGYHSKKLEAQRAELQQLQDTYIELLDGVEDPRIGDLSSKNRDLEAKLQELEQVRDQLQNEYQEFQAAWENQIYKMVSEQAERFKRDNAWIFEKPELEKLGEELMDEGWGVDHLPRLLKLPGGVLKRIRSTFVESGKSNPDLAIRAVMAEVASRSNGAEEFVSGSEGASPRSPVVQNTDLSAIPLRERAIRAARKHLAKR
jgi:hypothetical protein